VRYIRWLGGGLAVVMLIGALDRLVDRRSPGDTKPGTVVEQVEAAVEGLLDELTPEPSTPLNSDAVRPTTAPTTTPTLPSTAPPTTTPEPVPAVVDGGVRALDLLSLILVAAEDDRGYDRELFEHWITQDRGCSTRELVLIEEALGLPQIDLFGCKVIEGDWLSRYDGRRHTDPADLDIDHVVALKEAWRSGASTWTPERRRAFANDLSDPRTLRAVTDEVNQSKGDRDPASWLPPDTSAQCGYLGDWVAIKARWRLTMDATEERAIRRLLETSCAGTSVAALGAPPVPPPDEDLVLDLGGFDGPDIVDDVIYYGNCAAARAVGAAPLYVGRPGYRVGLDRDRDGVACE
jgi:hypothetical protein